MSWYVLAFQLPWLPDVAARRGWIDALARRTLPRADLADALHGLQLYRANMLRAGRTPPPRVEDVPVLVIAPDRDPHVSVALQTQAPAPFVAQLRTAVVPGGHWVILSRPAEIARLVDGFVRG
jgi:pimeloyl-ACP methyl ester carboxylesterase